MNAKLHLLLLLLLCSIGATASPDSLRRLELFIDTDPGIGAGTQYTISVQRDTFSGSGITMGVPPGISPGWHTLYVRSFADSFGNGGRWGQTAGRQFFVALKLVAAEYFFDTDPGTGAGTSINVTIPADTLALSATVSTAGLLPGLHTIYTRSKDNRGIWGSVKARNFFIKDAVIAGEYFFDNDPGVSNGTAFSFTPTGDTVTKSLSVSTPASMADGKHILYVRTKNAGKWSVPQARDFYVLPRINAAEYYFDNDPGTGNGTPLAVSPVSDTVSGAYSLSTAALGGGQHRLYVRTRSVSGRWSLAQERSFYVRPKIVAAEYFWDTDPGIGGGVSLSVPLQSDTVAQTYNIKAPCIAPGTHYLYIRAKDEWGHWSVTAEDTVTLSNPAIVATATYPGPGPYGTPVKVKGSGGMPPYIYKMGSGTATADSVFLPANNTSVIFTAIDTCGYSGNANITTPLKPVIIAGGSTGSGNITLTGYRFWAYVQDASGNIIGAIRDNRQSLGTVTMSYLKNNSGTVRTYPFNSMKYLDRNWYIASGNAPVGNVGVQLFAVDTEYNALVAADPLVTSKSTLRINKYDGANEDLSIANNSGLYTILTPDSVVTFTGSTTPGNGYALAFCVADFSEFYESRNTAVPLMLQSVALKAERIGSAIQLSWHTEGEQNTAAHILSRGAGGGSMEPISTQPSGPRASNDYRFLDEAPLQGANYYRVAIRDLNGGQYYSQVAVMRVGEARTLTLSPNPAQDVMHISGLQGGDGINLRDIAGHTVWQGIATGSELNIKTTGFASGMYMLTVAADGTISQRPLTDRK